MRNVVPSDPPGRKVSAIVGSALFLIVAAGTGAGLVPWWISRWKVQPPLFGFPPIRAFGAFLIVLGILVVLDSFARFALQGLGTPAPVFPTRHLVVTGFYRHVRNPIYLAVVSIVLGEGAILGNVNHHVRSACLARHPCVRRGIRGAHVAEDFRR